MAAPAYAQVVPELLAGALPRPAQPATRRRTGQLLDARGMYLDLLAAAITYPPSYAKGHIDNFGILAWCAAEELADPDAPAPRGSTAGRARWLPPRSSAPAPSPARMSWWSARRARTTLQLAALIELAQEPFSLGSLLVHRDRVVHSRQDNEHYVQLRSTDALVAKHKLSCRAGYVLRELVIAVHDAAVAGSQARRRLGCEDPDGAERARLNAIAELGSIALTTRSLHTTLRQLGHKLELGRYTLRAALGELEAAALISVAVTRGHGLSLTLTPQAWDALVVAPAPTAQAPPKPRPPKPPLPTTPDDNDVCLALDRLARHFGLARNALEVSVGLSAVLREALDAGIRADELLVGAGRSLDGLNDPIAGIVVRLRTFVAATLDARARNEARAAKQAARQREERDRAEEEARAEAAQIERDMAELEWLHRNMTPVTYEALQGLYTHLGGIPQPKRMRDRLVLAHARRAVAARPDLDPVQAVAASTTRRLDEGPIGSLPRAGPP